MFLWKLSICSWNWGSLVVEGGWQKVLEEALLSAEGIWHLFCAEGQSQGQSYCLCLFLFYHVIWYYVPIKWTQNLINSSGISCLWIHWGYSTQTICCLSSTYNKSWGFNSQREPHVLFSYTIFMVLYNLKSVTSIHMNNCFMLVLNSLTFKDMGLSVCNMFLHRLTDILLWLILGICYCLVPWIYSIIFYKCLPLSSQFQSL